MASYFESTKGKIVPARLFKKSTIEVSSMSHVSRGPVYCFIQPAPEPNTLSGAEVKAAAVARVALQHLQSGLHSQPVLPPLSLQSSVQSLTILL